MNVYIEYVLIDNFVIDFLLLKCTFTITGKKPKNKRLVISSIIGALFALTYPLINAITPIIIAVKILFGLLLVLISQKYTCVKDYYVNVVIFFLLTFLTGGAIIGACNLLGINYSSEISIAIMFLPTYIIIKTVIEGVKYIYRRKEEVKNQVEIELIYKNNRVKTQGFIDTGNNLYSKGNPVVVISKKVFLGLTKNQLPTFWQMEYATVSGKGKMLCFNIDEMRIYNLAKPNIYTNVTVGFNKNSIGVGYSVILHPYYMEEGYAKNNNGQTKKAC